MWGISRLCRGDSRSITFQGAPPEYPHTKTMERNNLPLSILPERSLQFEYLQLYLFDFL
jgi:hypothetical protein